MTVLNCSKGSLRGQPRQRKMQPRHLSSCTSIRVSIAKIQDFVLRRMMKAGRCSCMKARYHECGQGDSSRQGSSIDITPFLMVLCTSPTPSYQSLGKDNLQCSRHHHTLVTHVLQLARDWRYLESDRRASNLLS
jgi:hypothetical protein